MRTKRMTSSMWTSPLLSQSPGQNTGVGVGELDGVGLALSVAVCVGELVGLGVLVGLSHVGVALGKLAGSVAGGGPVGVRVTMFN